ncbi:hypothetical protein ACJJIE_09715 [Microbulbifer sp. TRSA001]|uniref:hypothetical protein n=1 Tax=Microbulbifer sp. TRSA001 TaxID=3243381 RepID=UPI004039994D
MRFRKHYLLFLFVLLGINSHGDVAFGKCTFTGENVCVRRGETGSRYFSVEARNYRGHEIVWLSKIDSESAVYKWSNSSEGRASFYVFPKGYSPKRAGEIKGRDAIHVRLNNSSAEESVEQFFSVYEIVSRAKFSAREFESVFSGLSLWKRFLHRYGDFKKAYLKAEGRPVELKSVVYASTPECNNCLHFIFSGEGGRWLLSGVMVDSSVNISDLVKLD